MNDEAEVLIEMYKVQIQRSQHYENQRAGVTNIVITLSAALVGLAAFDQTISRIDFWNGLFILLLGIFGFIASYLHSSRSLRHGKRAEAYRNALNEKLPNADINTVRDKVQEPNTYLDQVWEGIHLTIIVLGIFICLLAIRK